MTPDASVRPAPPILLVASRNAKKRGELVELLAPHGIDVVGLERFPDLPEVVEDGETFAANAAKKACETAQRAKLWTLADDSGLCVEALDGRPGVFSARYAGPECDDAANNALLQRELADVPDARRGAWYVCHIAVADPFGQVRLSVEETCRGRIVREPRGANGFGYDPYFLIPEYGQTFGELSPLVKRSLSHRARALAKTIGPLVKWLRDPTAPFAPQSGS
jgi:XTP/dITP diphosphohydrolase